MHPSISITAPPALRVGGEDRSCVWARAAQTRLQFILSVYYAQWKTIHFEPLRIDIESSPVGRRWITMNHLLFFSFLIDFSALCSVKRSSHFAAGSSLAIKTSGFSVVRSDVSTACIREKEREDGERGRGRRRRAAAALHVSEEEKKTFFFSPPFHQCECSMRRADNEACSPALGAIRMQSGGFHVIRINN